MKSRHILIIGSGSVGRRHARNFAQFGCRISAVDPRTDRLDELAAEVSAEGRFTTLDEALVSGTHYDGAVIGSPPSVHVVQSLACLEAGIPLLLEKPVSPGLASAQRLAQAATVAGVPVLLGYTWRWWPPLRKVKALLAANRVGPLRHVQFHMSAHLADWHPWEPYQDFFMASQALGGGALLDESHWIDLALWLFGKPLSVSGRVEKLSDLEIGTDDNVDILLEYADRLRVSIHLDTFGRPHEKYIRFVGENGTLLWTVSPNRIAVSGEMEGWSEVHDFHCERNDMFVEIAKEFLDVLDGNPVVTCTLEDGLAVLLLVEATRRSSGERRVLSLEE